MSIRDVEQEKSGHSPLTPQEETIDGSGFGNIVRRDGSIRETENDVGSELASNDWNIGREMDAEHAQHVSVNLNPNATANNKASSRKPGGSAITDLRETPGYLRLANSAFKSVLS